MMLCSAFRTQIQTWLRDYDRIQSFAVILIYVQIGCALIGSLGALYNGVSLINLGIGLFALVAIESSSQSLGRTYAVLLFCAILVDISWFILFASEIWNISSGIYGTFVIFSVKLTLSMQIIGFCVRLSSSLLWIQMYKLGVSYIDCSVPREADSDMRNSFLNPATPITRQLSNSDDALGGSVYDPAYYSSLFEDGKDETYFCRGSQNSGFVIGSPSTAKTIQFKPSMSRSIRITDINLSTIIRVSNDNRDCNIYSKDLLGSDFTSQPNFYYCNITNFTDEKALDLFPFIPHRPCSLYCH